MKKTSTSKIFAYSRWDGVAVSAAMLQGIFLGTLFFLFPQLHWAGLLLMGLVYSISISWNINGISHNFLHNPYFRSPFLNRLFSIYESIILGFSQVFYECVHKRHHQGNSDKRDSNGQTVDWLSIYRYGRDGKPENVWAYTLLSYFRDDTGRTYQIIKHRDPKEAKWGVFEISLVIFLAISGFILNYKFMLYFLVFYYIGHCLSNLNGYYRHFGGNPKEPLAWGVSSYDKIYNWLWFNNGYHAEHHYRPQIHWTKMRELHAQVKTEMEMKGTHIIIPPHALAFLAPLFKKSSGSVNRGRF